MNSSRRIFPTEYVTLRNSVRRKNSNYPRIRTTVLWATSCCSVSSDTRKNLQFHLARLHVLFVNHLVQRNLKNPGHVFWTRKFSLGARTTLSFFRPSPIVHEACSSFYRDFPCPRKFEGEKLRPSWLTIVSQIGPNLAPLNFSTECQLADRLRLTTFNTGTTSVTRPCCVSLLAILVV